MLRFPQYGEPKPPKRSVHSSTKRLEMAVVKRITFQANALRLRAIKAIHRSSKTRPKIAKLE